MTLTSTDADDNRAGAGRPTAGSGLTVGGWPDLADIQPADRRVLVVIGLSAVVTDLALRSGVAVLAGALLVAVVAAGLVCSGRIENRQAWPVLLLTPAFGLWLGVRAAGWLIALDILAAAALLVVGSSLSKRGDPLDQSVPDLAGRALHALLHGFFTPGFVLEPLRRSRGAREECDETEPASRRAAPAVVRGILLGAPVVIVLGLLLASADPVFASMFRFPVDAGDVAVHAVLLAIGGWGSAALLRTASGAPYDVAPLGRRPLGSIEAVTVLGGLVAVFAAFAATQLVTVIAGADYVRRTSGLSYADYARRGFFQLLAVAAITLGLLLVLRATTDATDRTFILLGEAAVVLTLFLVAGAIRRLGLYEAAYGLTLLRLASTLFALWIGGVFVLLGLSLAGVGRGRAWFVPCALVLGLAGLLVVNFANPEAVIVRRNVERFSATDALDAWYLTDLSDDAVPALADALPRLRPEARALVVSRLCTGERRTDAGIWDFNASRQAAVDARNRVCPAASS